MRWANDEVDAVYASAAKWYGVAYLGTGEGTMVDDPRCQRALKIDLRAGDLDSIPCKFCSVPRFMTTGHCADFGYGEWRDVAKQAGLSLSVGNYASMLRARAIHRAIEMMAVQMEQENYSHE